MLPHLRRLPERVDRILTLTGGRPAGPHRHRRGQPADPADARQPGILVLIGASFLLVSTLLLVSATTVRPL